VDLLPIQENRPLGFALRFRPTYPDFLHGAPPTAACAAFIEESRMNFHQRKQGRQEIRSTLVRGAPVLLPLGLVMPGNIGESGGAGRNRTDA
jgi:hypothetical protein